jgi:uncharacterized delta-60 repeat protein
MGSNNMLLRHFLTVGSIALTVLLASPGQAADGDLDPGFSGDGKAVYDWPGSLVQVETTAVLTLADGSVVTAGWADHGSDDRDFAIAKFTRDGALDTNFGDAGTLLVPFNVVIGGDDRAFGVFAVAGNKLLVVGSADIGAIAPYRRPALLRLNANGQPDTTFGTGGKRVISTQPFGAGASQAFKIARRAPDGKLLIGGYCQNCGNGSPPDFLALRLSAEGDVDTSFGNAGWVAFGRFDDNNFWLNEQVNDLAADSSGRVVLSGTSQLDSDPNHIAHPLLARFTATGQLDTTFNGTGIHEINMLGSWGVSAIAMDLVTDGPILAVNLVDPGAATPAAVLMRLGSNGVINTAFGENGLADLTRDEGSHIDALTIREDRRIMAAGWIDPNGADERDFFLARTLSNGDLDTGFDGNGVKRVPFNIVSDAYDRAGAMTLSNERAVVAGTLFAPHTNVHYATGVLRLQSPLLFADGFE